MENFEYAQKIKSGELPPLEVDTNKELMDHECVAASFGFLMKKILLLDEMGVGKTMSSIGALKLISNEKINKVVLFAPGATLYQWSDAIEAFLGWKRVIVDGDKSHRLAQLSYFEELQENVVLITNFSRPLHDIEGMLAVHPTSIVVDEATFVKNPESGIYKFLDKFSKDVEYFFLLTGTPITLTLGDIYWLFSILKIPNVLGSYEEEVVPYLEVKKSGAREQIIGASGFDVLKDKLEPYCIRRTLLEVYANTDDPMSMFVNEKPKLEVVPLSYDNNQAEFFQQLKVEANRASREGNYKPLETYQFFLQGCSSPSLVRPGFEGQSPKEKYLLDYIQSVDTKVVVYVRYLEYLRYLKTTLDNVNIGYNIITGQYTSYEQEVQKNAFLESDNRVLFITGAGKYGLNLQKANDFIFLDIPYNPADIPQMINRIYRYGQLGEVRVKLVFLENTIEEDIFRKLKKRQAVLDEYFDTDLSSIFVRPSEFIWGFLEKEYPKKES